jgi:hypothetical protein
VNAVMAVTREPIRDAEAMVRVLLKEWVAYRKGWSPHIGYPGAVPWIERFNAGVDGWTEGRTTTTRSERSRCATSTRRSATWRPTTSTRSIVVYLNEVGPAVWRSSRKPMVEIRALCAEAERRLVVALRSRDVVV